MTSVATRRCVIAVVEDEPSVHQLLRTLLMRHGYVTVHADTLPQLRAVVQVQAIDAFMVDLRLKGEHNGLDLIRLVAQPDRGRNRRDDPSTSSSIAAASRLSESGRRPKRLSRRED